MTNLPQSWSSLAEEDERQDWTHCKSNAKPQDSLTAPNCHHFAQVSLMVLDNFFGCNRQS